MILRRREFITLLGGAAAGWPLAARAQRPTKILKVGTVVGRRQPEIIAAMGSFRKAYG